MSPRPHQSFLHGRCCVPADARGKFVRLLHRIERSLASFEGRAGAKTWLLSIARRTCADAVRDRRRRPRVDPGATVPERAQGGDLSDGVALRRQVGALSPDRRDAFVLTQLVGLSYPEAAEVCAVPVGTIRSRVARAREDLVAGLAERPDRTG